MLFFRANNGSSFIKLLLGIINKCFVHSNVRRDAYIASFCAQVTVHLKCRCPANFYSRNELICAGNKFSQSWEHSISSAPNAPALSVLVVAKWVPPKQAEVPEKASFQWQAH